MSDMEAIAAIIISVAIPRDVVETIALVALFVISGGLCALIGYALGRMRGEDPPESRRPPRTSPRGPKGAATSL